MYSTSAVLVCGSVFKGDVVYLRDGAVGCVEKFWALHDDAISVQLSMFQPADGRNRWSTSAPTTRFVSVEDILDCVTYKRTGDVVLVIPPFKAYLPGVVV